MTLGRRGLVFWFTMMMVSGLMTMVASFENGNFDAQLFYYVNATIVALGLLWVGKIVGRRSDSPGQPCGSTGLLGARSFGRGTVQPWIVWPAPGPLVLCIVFPGSLLPAQVSGVQFFDAPFEMIEGPSVVVDGLFTRVVVYLAILGLVVALRWLFRGVVFIKTKAAVGRAQNQEQPKATRWKITVDRGTQTAVRMDNARDLVPPQNPVPPPPTAPPAALLAEQAVYQGPALAAPLAGGGGFAGGVAMGDVARMPASVMPVYFPAVNSVAVANMFYGGKPVSLLKEILRSRMLPVSGVKSELIARLINNDRAFGRVRD
jgi:hypothetical protein